MRVTIQPVGENEDPEPIWMDEEQVAPGRDALTVKKWREKVGRCGFAEALLVYLDNVEPGLEEMQCGGTLHIETTGAADVNTIQMVADCMGFEMQSNGNYVELKMGYGSQEFAGRYQLGDPCLDRRFQLRALDMVELSLLTRRDFRISASDAKRWDERKHIAVTRIHSSEEVTVYELPINPESIRFARLALIMRTALESEARRNSWRIPTRRVSPLRVVSSALSGSVVINPATYSIMQRWYIATLVAGQEMAVGTTVRQIAQAVSQTVNNAIAEIGASKDLVESPHGGKAKSLLDNLVASLREQEELSDNTLMNAVGNPDFFKIMIDAD